MSAAGRYFDSIRAVLAVSVKTAMARMLRSRAACAMDSQMVSAMDRRRAGRCSGSRGSERMSFGLGHNAGHHLDRFAGELADRALAGKHDRVGAVEDGVGHVAGLGPRGTRVLGHGLEHLRGRDDRLAEVERAANDMLLDERHLLRRNLDAKIAAGHHHSVRDLENGFKIFDGLRLLQLGNERSIAAMRGNRPPGAHHIVGGAHKRDGDQVNRVLQTECEVRLVLLGERRNADVRSGQVDALVLTQHPAVQHLADDVVAGDFLDHELNPAVGKENVLARFYIAARAAGR